MVYVPRGQASTKAGTFNQLFQTFPLVVGLQIPLVTVVLAVPSQLAPQDLVKGLYTYPEIAHSQTLWPLAWVPVGQVITNAGTYNHLFQTTPLVADIQIPSEL